MYCLNYHNVAVSCTLWCVAHWRAVGTGRILNGHYKTIVSQASFSVFSPSLRLRMIVETPLRGNTDRKRKHFDHCKVDQHYILGQVPK